MLLQTATCPICEQSLNPTTLRCPSCRCLVQFTPDPPAFTRGQIDEGLVQTAIDRCRAQLQRSPQDGAATYTLGLSYLNYELVQQGLDQLRRAAELLPEKHALLFELAVLLNTPTQYGAALDYAVQLARLAPERIEHQYILNYLQGRGAYMRRELHAAITSWITAYQLAPQWQPAADSLQQFVAAHQAKLTQPIAQTLPGLNPQDAENLRVLNSNPALQKQSLPRPPRAPGKLGSLSLGLLRRVSPTRAAAIEQMHEERLASYQQATVAYQAESQVAATQREASSAAWQAQEQATRQNVGAMARLCLAVVQQEERLRLEEERRRAEAEQRRQAAEQRRQEAQARANAGAAQKKVREKQYYSTKAQYISGLPQGKEKDDVSLVVTNLQISVKHSGMIGGWEQAIPIPALMEVSAITVKHFMSSEKRLQISYRDASGMIAHAIFAGLKADDGVNAILKARSGK